MTRRSGLTPHRNSNMFTYELRPAQECPPWTSGACLQKRFSAYGDRRGSPRQRWREDWGSAVRRSTGWGARAKTSPCGPWLNSVGRFGASRGNFSAPDRLLCEFRPEVAETPRVRRMAPPPQPLRDCFSRLFVSKGGRKSFWWGRGGVVAKGLLCDDQDPSGSVGIHWGCEGE